jgi:hypothetical protein
MDEARIPAAIEPNEWFVVFHRKSFNRWLGWLAMGEFKHVSVFGYCPGLKVWLLYDVQWSGTRIMLVDQATLITWSNGCDILKIKRVGAHMGLSSRLGLTCVSTVKHLVGLRCVAATPDQLYRHILRNGGISICERPRRPTGPGRSEPRERAAASSELAGQEPADADPGRHGLADGALRHAAGHGGVV